MQMRLALLALLLTPMVTALGISQDFHENNTISVMQGDSYLHRVTVQNGDDEPLTVNFSVSGDFLSVNGSEAVLLELPARSANTEVYINVTIPKDVPAGTVLTGRFSVQPLIAGEGTVNMALRLSDSFNVLVTEKPGRSYPWLQAIVAVAVGVLLLALFRGTQLAYVAVRKRATAFPDYIAQLQALDDKVFLEQLHSGSIAQSVFKYTKNPELYHKLKVAKKREEVLDILHKYRK